MQLTSTLSLAIALSMLGAIGTVREALADEDETRVSAFGVVSLDELAAFEGSSSTQTYGGGLAVAQGVRNWLDLGMSASYRQRSDVIVDGAALGGVGGDEQYQLYTNLQVFESVVTARSYLEVGPFLRLRPMVGVRAGVQATRYGDPELFFEEQSRVAVGESEWDLSFLKGAELGVAYRLTDLFEMAVLVRGDTSATQSSFSLTFEFSWQRS